MRNLFEHKIAVFVIGITIAVAIIIGIFGALSTGDKASVSENVVESGAKAGQSAASGIGGWFSNLFGGFGDVKALKEENEKIKFEKAELDKKLRDAEGLEEENAELRQMLDLMKKEPKLDLEAATVIAKDPSNWYSTFTINKGSNSGIEKNQPVITAKEELIGQVYKVGSDWAEVITIFDPDCGVGSLVERTGDIGVLEGDASLRLKGQCHLGYLSRDSSVEPKDYLETSGMGGVYPKGLLIGRIVEVKEDVTNMSKFAIVEPLADIEKVKQVFVIKNYVEEVVRIEKKDKDDEDQDEDGETESKSNEEDSSEYYVEKKEAEEENEVSSSSDGSEMVE